MRCPANRWATLLALLLLSLPADGGAQPAFQLLHGFADPPRNPFKAPVQASNGSLYGTTLDVDEGWGLVSQEGNHRQFKHPNKSGRVTVSRNLGDDMPKGTLASVKRQAGVKAPKP